MPLFIIRYVWIIQNFVKNLNLYQSLNRVIRFVLNNLNCMFSFGLQIYTFYHLPKRTLADVVDDLILDILGRYDDLILSKHILTSTSQSYFLSIRCWCIFINRLFFIIRWLMRRSLLLLRSIIPANIYIVLPRRICLDLV